eukprot:15364474-Ditylum_brightwellii.AAC.1
MILCLLEIIKDGLFIVMCNMFTYRKILLYPMILHIQQLTMFDAHEHVDEGFGYFVVSFNVGGMMFALHYLNEVPDAMWPVDHYGTSLLFQLQ